MSRPSSSKTIAIAAIDFGTTGTALAYFLRSASDQAVRDRDIQVVLEVYLVVLRGNRGWYNNLKGYTRALLTPVFRVIFRQLYSDAQRPAYSFGLPFFPLGSTCTALSCLYRIDDYFNFNDLKIKF